MNSDNIKTLIAIDFCTAGIAKAIAVPLIANNSIAFTHSLLTLVIAQVAWAILSETPIRPTTAVCATIILSAAIPHFMSYTLWAIALTPTASSALMGVTALAIMTSAFFFAVIFGVSSLHIHPLPVSNTLEAHEDFYNRNLDVLRDFLGIPRKYPDNDIPYHRLTHELAFVSIYTAAMFLGGYLCAWGSVIPIVNGILLGSIAFVDSFSRIIFARMGLWDLNVKDATHPLSLCYSFVVVNFGTRALLNHFVSLPTPVVNMGVISIGIAITELVLAIFILQKWSPPCLQQWIFKQPPLPTQQPNPQPLSLQFPSGSPNG